MANDRTEILFPEGRLIMGNLFKGSDKDNKGNPRVVKSGPNAGNPTTQFFIGVAYPKGGEQHWSQTAWGQKLLAVGHASHPGMYQNPAFSWKVDDGDSTVPNKANRRPCDSEGAKGHWVVKFSTNIPTKVYAKPNGALTQVTDENAVKTGYWVIVNASSTGNTGDSPGIYINHEMVLCTRADTVIENGPDAAAVFAGVALDLALAFDRAGDHAAACLWAEKARSNRAEAWFGVREWARGPWAQSARQALAGWKDCR